MTSFVWSRLRGLRWRSRLFLSGLSRRLSRRCGSHIGIAGEFSAHVNPHSKVLCGGRVNPDSQWPRPVSMSNWRVWRRRPVRPDCRSGRRLSTGSAGAGGGCRGPGCGGEPRRKAMASRVNLACDASGGARPGGCTCGFRACDSTRQGAAERADDCPNFPVRAPCAAGVYEPASTADWNDAPRRSGHFNPLAIEPGF